MKMNVTIDHWRDELYIIHDHNGNKLMCAPKTICIEHCNNNGYNIVSDIPKPKVYIYSITYQEPIYYPSGAVHMETTTKHFSSIKLVESFINSLPKDIIDSNPPLNFVEYELDEVSWL